MAALAPGSADPETSPEVRVGIVAFQNFRQEFERYERLFGELSAASQPRLQFRIAIGTYGDVLHWLDRKLIDVAVVSPGVFEEALRPAGAALESAAPQYLATRLKSAISPLASKTRGVSGPRHEYRSVCLVSSNSSLRQISDFRRADGRQVQFLFVHPLSVSGRIAPEFALKQASIPISAEQVKYTYSHSNSLQLVVEPNPDAERVAFVWDDALGELPEFANRVRKLDFPELEALSIPQDAVLARAGFVRANEIAALLAEHRDQTGAHGFSRFDDWESRYASIRAWKKALDWPAENPEAQMVSLDEIGWILLHYARSQRHPPRLALVLSGGGAKCAYQIGAVSALEQKLANLRRDNPEKGLDIALVVGTSGGAINAVPVAMGITATPEGRQAFRKTWEELDQREIVCPPALVRANMGLWFALLQIAVVLFAVRRFVRTETRRGWAFASILVLLAVPQFVSTSLTLIPWSVFGRNHVLHHLWLYCTFGSLVAAGTLLGAGLVSFAAQWRLVRRGKHLALQAQSLKTFLIVGILGLPLLQLYVVLFRERTISEGAGIERVFSREFGRLVDHQLASSGKPPIKLDPGLSHAQRLATISQSIFDHRLLRRDLVLTGSCLSQTAADLPSDLYFYADSEARATGPRFGSTGYSLWDRPSILLDVVIGSGAIFPLFPPRTLEDFPRAGDNIELIDGGFAHNSPIEAAVLWGATHVVLIEASPPSSVAGNNFFGNAIGAFNYLYYQAQIIDLRKKEQVVIFTLRPEPPHICVLDFAGNLVSKTIDKGNSDALGEVRTRELRLLDQPRFRKELGEPLFWDVHAP